MRMRNSVRAVGKRYNINICHEITIGESGAFTYLLFNENENRLLD